LGALGRLHRLELLVGRQGAALGDHLGLHLDADVLEDVDRDLVAADPLDRVAVDLAPVDADLLRLPELVDDVGRRDRAEQAAGRAGLDLEAEHDLPERLGDRLGVLERLRLVAGALGVALLQLRDAGGGRLLGEPPRQEVVPRVAARHRDDVAAQADVVDVPEEDDLHQRSPLSRSPRSRRLSPPGRSSAPSATYGRSAISRARFTACATCTWWRRQAPVMRRLRIFPFSEMYRRSWLTFL